MSEFLLVNADRLWDVKFAPILSGFDYTGPGFLQGS